MLSDEEQVQRDQLRANWDRLAHLDEIFWHRKSRILWLWEGGNNTKFFLKMANSNRRRNQVQVIEVNGAFYDVEADIREQMVLFYTNLYQESEVWHPDVDGLPFATIGEEDCRLLERNFDKEEVCGVLRDLQ